MSEVILDAATGVVRCEHKKVAIVGTGPGREQVPYRDPSWCVWALNEIPQESYTRHFELHPMEKQSARELKFLAECPAPCYVLDLAAATSPRQVTVDGTEITGYPGVRNAVSYPLQAILGVDVHTGRTRRRPYFTCTFAFQLALAVHEGFDVVGLWGVQLYRGTARERLGELRCVEYWLGVAEGRGIEVVEDSRCAWQPYLYGYDYDQELKYAKSECERFRAVAEVEKLAAAAGVSYSQYLVQEFTDVLPKMGWTPPADWAERTG